MKYIKTTAVFLGVLLAGYGCSDDFLEKQSLTDETESNFYQTEQQALQALVSIYDALQYSNGRTADTYAPWDILNNILSDDAYTGGSGSGDRPGLVRMGTHQSVATDSEVLAAWEDRYVGIARANLFLTKVDGITFTSPEIKNRYISEAKFLRANFYFQLVRLYGHVPLILEPLAPSEFNEVVQAEPMDVYRQIATDLMEAINGNLPRASALPANEYGRITIAAAKGMLMKVYLYYEGYGKGVMGFTENLRTNQGTEITLQMVQGYADDIITSGDYQLVPDFKNLWGVSNEVNSEFIFQVRFSDLRDWGDWGARNYSEGNWAAIMYGFRIQSDNVYAEGWSFAPVTHSLVNLYADNDSRKAASFVHESELNSFTEGYQHTGYAFKKFHPNIADDPLSANRMLNQPFDRPDLRLADVLLMGAELNLSTNMGKAREYFNAVYQRATGTEFDGDLSLDVIFEERRREFAGEGQRYFDLMRRGLDYTAQQLEQINLGGDFNVSFNPARKGLLPIPQREINLNPNLRQFVY
jgi:hypothetical protein